MQTTLASVGTSLYAPIKASSAGTYACLALLARLPRRLPTSSSSFSSFSSFSSLLLCPPHRQHTHPLPRTHAHLFATMIPIERVAERLEAPALDDRSYRVVRLPNKLEALLVHDPETDKASAAVNVNVGSFSDPDDMAGLAHALEHMLFMGTKKVGGPCHRGSHLRVR